MRQFRAKNNLCKHNTATYGRYEQLNAAAYGPHRSPKEGIASPFGRACLALSLKTFGIKFGPRAQRFTFADGVRRALAHDLLLTEVR